MRQNGSDPQLHLCTGKQYQNQSGCPRHLVGKQHVTSLLAATFHKSMETFCMLLGLRFPSPSPDKRLWGSERPSATYQAMQTVPHLYLFILRRVRSFPEYRSSANRGSQRCTGRYLICILYLCTARHSKRLLKALGGYFKGFSYPVVELSTVHFQAPHVSRFYILGALSGSSCL